MLSLSEDSLWSSKTPSSLMKHPAALMQWLIPLPKDRNLVLVTLVQNIDLSSSNANWNKILSVLKEENPQPASSDTFFHRFIFFDEEMLLFLTCQEQDLICPL